MSNAIDMKVLVVKTREDDMGTTLNIVDSKAREDIDNLANELIEISAELLDIIWNEETADTEGETDNETTQ